MKKKKCISSYSREKLNIIEEIMLHEGVIESDFVIKIILERAEQH